MSLINVEGLGINNGKMNEPVPPGKYRMRVDNVEETESKSHKPMLKLKHVICDGDSTNRVVFDNMVLPNTDQSEDANRMATTRIKRFLNAIGVNVENDGFNTDDIIGKEFTGVVGVRSTTEYPDPINEIKDYLTAN